MKISEQTRYRGVVVYVHEAGTASYGFVELEGEGPDRAKNVWFGSLAIQGLPVEKGDICDLILAKPNPWKKNRSAYRIWVRTPAIRREDREEIVTLAGELET
jgi:hypothetical protein